MIRKAIFKQTQDGIICQITEGPVHGDTVYELYVGDDWHDAQGFVNKLQRSIFMKDANL